MSAARALAAAAAAGPQRYCRRSPYTTAATTDCCNIILLLIPRRPADVSRQRKQSRVRGLTFSAVYLCVLYAHTRIHTHIIYMSACTRCGASNIITRIYIHFHALFARPAARRVVQDGDNDDIVSSRHPARLIYV